MSTFTNFRFEIDADGIALATWDMPGRSMNVITPEVMDELAQIVETVAGDEAIKGCVITSGKEAFSGGADLDHAAGARRANMRGSRRRRAKRRPCSFFFEESRKLSLLYRRLETCGKPFAAAMHGVCLGGAFELALACHFRVLSDVRFHPRRPARGQGRAFPRRRRHAARGAPDADGRCAADAVQGRADPPAHGAQHGPRSCGRAARRDRRRRRRTGSSSGGSAVAPWDQKGYKLPSNKVYSAAGMQIWPAGQRHLPPRDAGQLPGRPRHSGSGLSGPAAADGSGAEGRVALVRQDPALEGSGGDDPHALHLHAGSEQGRAPSQGRAADEPEEGRRRRRGLHGRERRLCDGQCGHRGRAHRPRHGSGRKGQGPFAQAHVRPDHEGPRQDGGSRCAARAHHAIGRLRRSQGLRSRHRGRVRGSEGQGRGDPEGRGGDPPGLHLRLQHLDPADLRAGQDSRSSPTSSSASISSRRSRR